MAISLRSADRAAYWSIHSSERFMPQQTDRVPPLAVPAAPAYSPAHDAVPLPAVRAEQCANCGAPLGGHFCGECGAPRLDERPLTVRRFAHDLWNEVTNLDSGTLQTVRALFLAPGLLTREYLRGRTRAFLSPLRIFLLATALHIFALSAMGYRQMLEDKMQEGVALGQQRTASQKALEAARKRQTAPQADVSAPLKAIDARKLERKRIMRQALRSLPATITNAMTSAMTNQWVQLLNPLAMAAVLMLIFRRRRQNYATHVVHALHILSFNAVLSIATYALTVWHGAAHTTFDICVAFNLIILCRYFYLSTHRLYGDSARRTALDTGLFAIGGPAAIFSVPFVVMIVSVLWFLGGLFLRVAMV